jgi:hypothetical protein
VVIKNLCICKAMTKSSAFSLGPKLYSSKKTPAGLLVVPVWASNSGISTEPAAYHSPSEFKSPFGMPGPECEWTLPD